MDTVETIAPKMIDLLNEKGWIQGRYSAPEGYCLLGALIEVTKNLPTNTQHDLICGFKRKFTAYKGMLAGVIDWNDTEGRSKYQVINVLKDMSLPLTRWQRIKIWFYY